MALRGVCLGGHSSVCAMGSGLRSRTSEVGYARVADTHVAYRVIAGGGLSTHDVVLLGSGTASMEAAFEDPIGVRLLDGMAGLGRLVVFDRRGIGLSDPPGDWDEPESLRSCEDLESVVAAAQIVRPVLVSNRAAWPGAFVYCDRHPGEVAALVMFEPSGVRPNLDLVRAQITGEVDSVGLWCPSRADEPGFRDWFTRAGRSGASPTMAERSYPVPDDDEVRAIEQAAGGVTVPTLVLRRPASIFSPDRATHPILALVPQADRVDLPGTDALVIGGEADALLAEVTRFVTGEYLAPAPECVLAVVLFSDVVASTERVGALGGERWKRLLDRHDQVARNCLGRRSGKVVKTTGDGILATLPSATSAVRAAQELRIALSEEGLEVRIGMHVGDVDLRDDDVSGLAVNVAARIMHLAESGEILVSETVRLAASGTGTRFESRGRHPLKGIAGQWQLFRVSGQ
jgi:class 3 adenylate cyclase